MTLILIALNRENIMDKISTVSQCRLCDSSDIIEILNFGNIPLANNLRGSADLDKEEFTAPLRVFQCRACGSNQLFDEVLPELLFKNYNYSSPPNLRGHFEEYALTTSTNIGLEKDDLVIGIGGNNGLLELEYQKLGFSNVLNIEPAENISKISEKNGIDTCNKFFNIETAGEIFDNLDQKAKLITCNNCFGHIPDLNEIVKGIKILLDPRGYFVFENAYWLNTILNLDVGQCYHEHLYYHSIKPLKQFFEKHGLVIAEIELNKVQLGSFRCYVTWPENSSYNSSSVKNLIKLEEDFGLYRADIYEKFKRDVEYAGIKLRAQIELSGGKIALYGVPAKIVLLIKLFELEKYIDFACEDSEIKVGRFIPGTSIPIKSTEYWRMANSLGGVRATLIGAYNFADDIINKNSEIPKNNWIIPFK